MMHHTTTALRTKRGFTFIELLMVTATLAVLVGVVAVSFSGTSRSTRDARRKKDVANLQTALEIYKNTNGMYPSNGSTGYTTGCCDGSGSTTWIQGMVPDYMQSLPLDPKNTAEGVPAGDPAPQFGYGYYYTRPTNTTYRVVVRLENENDPVINGDDYGFGTAPLYVVTEPR